MALPLLLSFLGSGLAKAGVLGAAGSFLANPLVAGAIGSGLGTAIETGDVRKGLVGGLGSFAGGKLLGSMMGQTGGGAIAEPLAGQTTIGQGAGAMTTGTPLSSTAGNLLPPPPAAQGGIGGLLGGRAGDVLRGGMDFAQSAQGMGSMLGGMAASQIAPMLDRSRSSSTGTVAPTMENRSMQRQSRFPGPDFVPGQSPEFDYGVSTPYSSDYFRTYGMQRMAGGGMVQRMVPGYGPVRMQAGGIADVASASQEQPNEREVISAAVSAIRGKHANPERALGMFLAMFGEAALRDLVDRVSSGDVEETATRGEGALKGPGDGMSDMIPASIDGEQDVLLSDGEYVVPADVVSGLGNGSTDAGAKALDEMAARIRKAKTGQTRQPAPVPKEAMVPA